MTYHTDIAAEEAWNRSSTRPGKPREISRSNPNYKRGWTDYQFGWTECPFPENTSAALHWRAAQDDAAKGIGLRALV